MSFTTGRLNAEHLNLFRANNAPRANLPAVLHELREVARLPQHRHDDLFWLLRNQHYALVAILIAQRPEAERVTLNAFCNAYVAQQTAMEAQNVFQSVA